MLSVTIPGDRPYALNHIVLDYNGTLAFHGKPAANVHRLLEQISHEAEVHVITADTFGMVEAEMRGTNCRLTIIPEVNQDFEKRRYVRALGADTVVAIGNGRNDRGMLEEAALGIAIIGEEGAYTATVAAADIVCRSITRALELLLNPKRLIATMRC